MEQYKLIQDSYRDGAINIHDFFKYIYLTLFHHLLGTIQILKGKGLGPTDLPCDTKETVSSQTKKGSGEESVYKHKKSIVVMNHFPSTVSDSDFSSFMFIWQKKWNKLSQRLNNYRSNLKIPWLLQKWVISQVTAKRISTKRLKTYKTKIQIYDSEWKTGHYLKNRPNNRKTGKQENLQKTGKNRKTGSVRTLQYPIKVLFRFLNFRL